MDKIQKAIAKLSKKHRLIYFFLEQRLLAKNLSGLNVGKLKGNKNIYRVKHGKLRIIFRFSSDSLEVLDIGLRNDNTYRNY
jgi:mRNA-degrading endonuclease RelE of RelBE toxin-antitoxin system